MAVSAIKRKSKLAAVFCLLCCTFSKGHEASAKESATYPISLPVKTTCDRTIQEIPPPKSLRTCDLALYPGQASPGYGFWRFGPGLKPEKRFDLMPRGYDGKMAQNASELASFFTISDIHITDKETPDQAIFFGYQGGKGASVSAYSGVMLYTTHVLDAAVQTINAIHHDHPLNFGLSLGDACNSSHYNELRWFVDVMDGKRITPDSGVKDDPVPGPQNDYQDAFQAAGLDRSIPWYQVLGNHDHFWMGVKPPDDYVRKATVGTRIVKMGNIMTDPLGYNERTYYMGVLDGRTRYGEVVGVGPVATTPEPDPVPADPRRRIMNKQEWIREFFTTSSLPKGHGFSRNNAAKGFACYAFEPVSTVPLKVIVLDDTQRNDDPPGDIYGHSSLDRERYAWLVNELDKGQKEGKLMIVAAHAPIGIAPAGSELGWNQMAPVTEKQLLDKLHSYPNLILWVAGHRHLNAITPMPSPDASKPELGFWQVETASLRDFPQEFRIFSINLNPDGTISINTTNVDPSVKKGTPAAISRSYALAAKQLDELEAPLPSNAELFEKITPEMVVKLRGLPGKTR